jgi:hypothetical protein
MSPADAPLWFSSHSWQETIVAPLKACVQWCLPGLADGGYSARLAPATSSVIGSSERRFLRWTYRRSGAYL